VRGPGGTGKWRDDVVVGCCGERRARGPQTPPVRRLLRSLRMLRLLRTPRRDSAPSLIRGKQPLCCTESRCTACCCRKSHPPHHELTPFPPGRAESAAGAGPMAAHEYARDCPRGDQAVSGGRGSLAMQC
jgi:hypothetical protein